MGLWARPCTRGGERKTCAARWGLGFLIVTLPCFRWTTSREYAGLVEPEGVFGPKVDRWLVYTVAGLLTSIGYAQWQAATSGHWRHARRLGLGTAGTLLAID